MKYVIKIVSIIAVAGMLCACGNKSDDKPAESALPSYDSEASPEDEGVQTGENGEIIVPSQSEEYGNSNGKLIVKTPEVDGNYDVLTYHFPYSKLESITYELHFSDENQAKSVYEDKLAANMADLKIEGNVVTYTETDSEWIGFKKRDLLNNLSKTWEQLGYEVTNE